MTLGFFNAFDSNGDANVDFNEYVCGLSACCRGPQLERRKCKLQKSPFSKFKKDFRDQIKLFALVQTKLMSYLLFIFHYDPPVYIDQVKILHLNNLLGEAMFDLKCFRI